jgi:predicted nicotinamide N-methyase
VSAPAVGAAEERARPLAVRVGREELLLRQVPEEAREAGQGERANERVGYRLWGAALVAASRVAAMGDAGALRGKRVLEIGAGLGLLGLLAARSRFGASCVCLSDFQGRIVDNLAYNAALNSVGQVAECRAACLDWLAVAAEAGREAPGEVGQEQEQAEPGGSAAAHSAFLDHGSRAGRFDVILGSDLVCEEPDCALVAAVIRAKLAQGGLALVTLGSQESRYGVACFAETIARSGLAIEELPVAAPRFCLPPAGGAALERDDEVFIGTARAYRHFEVRLPPRVH